MLALMRLAREQVTLSALRSDVGGLFRPVHADGAVCRDATFRGDCRDGGRRAGNPAREGDRRGSSSTPSSRNRTPKHAGSGGPRGGAGRAHVNDIVNFDVACRLPTWTIMCGPATRHDLGGPACRAFLLLRTHRRQQRLHIMVEESRAFPTSSTCMPSIASPTTSCERLAA